MHVKCHISNLSKMQPKESSYVPFLGKNLLFSSVLGLLGVMADFLYGDGAPPWSRAARQAWFDTWCCVCLSFSLLVRWGSSSEKGGSPPSPPPPPPALGSHSRVATKRRVGFHSPASHIRVATGRAERDAPTPIFLTNHSSIMTAELVAIRKALNEMEKKKSSTKR